MSDQELRLKCLELAIQNRSHAPAIDAESFYHFIKGLDRPQKTKTIQD